MGLPLHLDPRLHVPAAGVALSAARLGGRRFHAIHGRPRPNDDGGLQIMYGIDGRRDLTETLLKISPATAARSLSASATARSTSGRTMSTAPRSTRPYCTAGATSVFRGACGRSCRRRPSVPQQCGVNRIRASGRRAASRGTTCRRSSCAGSPSTAQLGSQTSRQKRRLRRLGQRAPQRSSPTSSSMGSASAGCFASTTTPTRSTPRHSSPPSSGFCRPTMQGFARPCWQSRTS